MMVNLTYFLAVHLTILLTQLTMLRTQLLLLFVITCNTHKSTADTLKL